MPSGVSQGSAPPAGSAGAACSKAMFAKFGMRLIVPIIAHAAPGGRHPSIMVRMLVADDAAKLVRTVVLQRGLAGHVGDRHHPAEPGFGVELVARHHPVRAVEGAGHDRDPRTVNAAKAQRRAAVFAVVALRDRGGAECGRLAVGPAEIGAVDVGEGGERRAGGLLAHPAMTDADFYGRCRQRKADCAALAAAGQKRLCNRGHASSVSRKASCRTVSASPPAKTKSLTPPAPRAPSCPPPPPSK